MKLLFIAFAVSICCTSFSQVKITTSDSDSLAVFYEKLERCGADNIGYMPNALKNFSDKQQLIKSNLQGFNIYQSQVDNMPVLKPDATNAASLSIRNSISVNNLQTTANNSGKLNIDLVRSKINECKGKEMSLFTPLYKSNFKKFAMLKPLE